MFVLVTKPAIEIVGVACIFKSKVAVKVTIPEVMTASELTKSVLDIVKLAAEGQIPQLGRFAT